MLRLFYRVSFKPTADDARMISDEEWEVGIPLLRFPYFVQ
jgi:hypothetical protein